MLFSKLKHTILMLNNVKEMIATVWSIKIFFKRNWKCWVYFYFKSVISSSQPLA